MSIESSEPFVDGFVIHHGLKNLPTRQLIENSMQPHIHEYEPDDYDFRFTDKKSFLNWRKENNPMVLWLGDAATKLAGIAWIENAYSKGHRKNFGVRVYEGYLNQGLATLLSEEIHAQFDAMKPMAKTMFEMRTNNNAGFSIGVNLGYKLDENNSRSSARMQLFVRNDRNLR